MAKKKKDNTSKQIVNKTKGTQRVTVTPVNKRNTERNAQRSFAVKEDTQKQDKKKAALPDFAVAPGEGEGLGEYICLEPGVQETIAWGCMEAISGPQTHLNVS